MSPQWKAPKAGKSATSNPVFGQITRKGQKQLPKLDFPHLKLLKNECKKIRFLCYSRKYFGAGSWRVKRAGKRNGARKSEPAQKPLKFEFHPCEVTSLNCQGIKYLTNTSEAKCKQTQQQIFTLERIEFFMNVPE